MRTDAAADSQHRCTLFFIALASHGHRNRPAKGKQQARNLQLAQRPAKQLPRLIRQR
jgi:hypothetical protein